MTTRKARAETRAKEEADPCGMTARKARATARAKEEADPCGMTTRKARARTRSKAKPIQGSFAALWDDGKR
jgi:hypothetical protein